MEQYISFFENNLEDYLKILENMVGINSFTYSPENVNRLGIYTAGIFENLGFDAIFQPSSDSRFGKHLFLIKNSSILPTKKNSPTIALISHLDTVFSSEEETRNNFQWRRDGDKIYGPGTVDIKGGTVLIYMLLDVLRTFERRIFDRVNWYVLLDAYEEALSHDFGELVHELLPENVIGCLVFEGGTANNSEISIVTSRKGRATFDIEVEGRSAHAGNAHQQGANAIVELAEKIIEVSKLTNYANDLTINIGQVRGGSVVNRVPHEAFASGEMRAFSPEILDHAIQEVLDIQARTSADTQNGRPLITNVKILDKMSPWPPNQMTDSLFKIWELSGKELGMNVLQEARGGLSDGNYLSNYYPTLDGLGPAGGNAHCSEQNLEFGKQQEYVVISSFIHKGILNLTAIRKLASKALNLS